MSKSPKLMAFFWTFIFMVTVFLVVNYLRRPKAGSTQASGPLIVKLMDLQGTQETKEQILAIDLLFWKGLESIVQIDDEKKALELWEEQVKIYKEAVAVANSPINQAYLGAFGSLRSKWLTDPLEHQKVSSEYAPYLEKAVMDAKATGNAHFMMIAARCRASIYAYYPRHMEKFQIALEDAKAAYEAAQQHLQTGDEIFPYLFVYASIVEQERSALHPDVLINDFLKRYRVSPENQAILAAIR